MAAIIATVRAFCNGVIIKTQFQLPTAATANTLAIALQTYVGKYSVFGWLYTFCATSTLPIVFTRTPQTIAMADDLVAHQIIIMKSAATRLKISDLPNPPIPYFIVSAKIIIDCRKSIAGNHSELVAPSASCAKNDIPLSVYEYNPRHSLRSCIPLNDVDDVWNLYYKSDRSTENTYYF